MKAIWNGHVLAQSNQTIIIENNHYFPPDSIKDQFFNVSDTRTRCHWKGEASYFTLTVNNKENIDAAWYYPEPYEDAVQIKNYVAFWKDVEITE